VGGRQRREDIVTTGRTGAAPEGCTSVAPWVVTDGTGAFLGFAAQAFDGEERGRVVTEDGSIGHGEIRVGDTVVLAFDRRADRPVVPSPPRPTGAARPADGR
jgi:PhnB protein